MRLTHHQDDGGQHADLTDALAPKQREVLAYLALHPDGTRREALTTAIWPDAPADRPYNSFHATVSQLRRALRTATHDALSDITVHHDGHYALDRTLVTVDLWHLHDALQASRGEASEQQRRTALERVVDLYTGDFADGLAAEWLEAPREALRRDVLDTVSALVRLLRETEPEQALALLERARTFDRYNEAIYRDIARFQAHLGQRDAIPRTLALLTTTLAELDDQPSRETVALCEFLQRPRPAHRPTHNRAAG
jgi:DNA-binding SARP family transcriptional activator